ncbi:TIGR02234 family membrane protein [Corynebacterium qintianiae]|uniref:TIGR02234 family membrane protein n=1 Tax=Corynebacterium qintianiae TaxID=2709392 RepID=UPI0013E9E838|nr:TIGR02234 family membrane protein [Corynebacterium qintianiae]
MAQQTVDKGLSRLGAAGLGLGGVTVALFSRAPWMHVSYFDDRVGGGVRDLSGAQWSTEVSAVSLLLVAAAIAVLALRRLPRRVIGAICALAAAVAVVSPMTLLTGGADPERVRVLLTAGAEDVQARAGSISGMAELTSVELNSANLALTTLGFALAIAGGAAVALRPGRDSAKLNKYETEAVRKQKIGSDLQENPDSGRVLWDALDADLDPTDPSPDGSNPAGGNAGTRI